MNYSANKIGLTLSQDSSASHPRRTRTSWWCLGDPRISNKYLVSPDVFKQIKHHFANSELESPFACHLQFLWEYWSRWRACASHLHPCETCEELWRRAELQTLCARTYGPHRRHLWTVNGYLRVGRFNRVRQHNESIKETYLFQGLFQFCSSHVVFLGFCRRSQQHGYQSEPGSISRH